MKVEAESIEWRMEHGTEGRAEPTKNLDFK